MKVHRGALKHGVSNEDAVQAAGWPQWIEPLDDELPRGELRLGCDAQARLLETVVLIFDSGGAGDPRDVGPQAVLGAPAVRLAAHTICALSAALGARQIERHQNRSRGCRVVADDPSGRSVGINQSGHCL